MLSDYGQNALAHSSSCSGLASRARAVSLCVAPLVMFTASRAKMGEPIVPSWLIARSIILLSSVLLGWSVTIL